MGPDSGMCAILDVMMRLQDEHLIFHRCWWFKQVLLCSRSGTWWNLRNLRNLRLQRLPKEKPLLSAWSLRETLPWTLIDVIDAKVHDHCNLWAICGLQSVLECLEAFSAMEFFWFRCPCGWISHMFWLWQWTQCLPGGSMCHPYSILHRWILKILRFFTLVSTCQQHHLLGRQTRHSTEACQDFILAMKCRSAKDRERKKNVEAPFD